MKKQRFNIVPAFCNKTNHHGFKFVDTEQELGETSIFFTMFESQKKFFEIVPKMKAIGYSLEDGLKTMREFDHLIDEIIKLPIPPISYVNKNTKEIADEIKEFFESVIFAKEFYNAIQEWALKKLRKEIFIYIPQDFLSNRNPWICILIPSKQPLSSEEFKDIFRKLESKQQAIALLDEAFKKEEINRTDYVLTLNKIQNLDNLPDQTHQEKMDSISKQN